MSYQQYGISRELVERIKLKMKSPAAKERVKNLLDGVTKQDLQDRETVKKLLGKMSRALNEKLTERQSNQLADFVIAQQIDPNNTFHLIKLWAMFR